MGKGITGKWAFCFSGFFKFLPALLWVQREPLVLQGQVSSKDLPFLEMSGQKLDSHLEGKL